MGRVYHRAGGGRPGHHWPMPEHRSVGNDGQAEEDLACAERILACPSTPAPIRGRGAPRAASAGERLQRAVELGYAGVQQDDVALCLQVDRFDFAMRASDEDGLLTLRGR